MYGPDISTHPKHSHEGIGGMLYDARKDLVAKLNLRRMECYSKSRQIKIDHRKEIFFSNYAIHLVFMSAYCYRNSSRSRNT
jgi:hypothetical protein